MTTKKRYFIHSYKAGSNSAKELAKALGARRILLGGKSKYKHNPKTGVVINWGSSVYHVADEKTPMLNPPQAVGKASNKLSFFNLMEGSVARIPFTTRKSDAFFWLNSGITVVARQKLTGHSGEGIVILDPTKKDYEKELDIPDAKVYTKYVPKSFEYRVHVFDGKSIRVQKKILRPELTERLRDPKDTFCTEDINWEVRNLDNGFIYITEGFETPPSVISSAIRALRTCKLDFGAVDIIWSSRKKSPFVLEVNTAPGLVGGTLEAYTKAILEYVPKEVFKVPSMLENPYRNFPFKEIYSEYEKSVATEAPKAVRGEEHRDWCSFALTSSKILDLGFSFISLTDWTSALKGEVTDNIRLFAAAYLNYMKGK